jgi:hypothetical protein
LQTADWVQAAQQPARNLAQLPTDQPAPRRRPAILRAALPRPGIYFSFEQFLANRPDTTAQLRLDTLNISALGWEGTLHLRPQVRNASGARLPARELWGFSDGRQAYIRQNATFCPLTRQGEFVTFIGPAPLDVGAATQRAQNSAWAGGMLGSMVADGSVDDQTGKPMVFALDTRSGLVAPFPMPGQVQPNDTAFIYIYQPAGTAESKSLFLNDRKVGQLRPGQYLEVAHPRFGQAIRLSFGTVGSPALLLVPDTTRPNYVKLLPTSAAPWQWMPPRQGEAEVDALEKSRQ